jgi:tetratricopeptide (TPR) repeat protein
VAACWLKVPEELSNSLLIGQLWTEIGDYARAVSTLQRSLASNPPLARAHFYSGLTYIPWEHWPEAGREFQSELNLTPGDPDAQYHLGFVYMQQSKTDEAATLFRQVVAAHPDYFNAQYQLGKVLLDRGQPSDAVRYLEAAARLQPQTDYLLTSSRRPTEKKTALPMPIANSKSISRSKQRREIVPQKQ